MAVALAASVFSCTRTNHAYEGTGSDSGASDDTQDGDSATTTTLPPSTTDTSDGNDDDSETTAESPEDEPIVCQRPFSELEFGAPEPLMMLNTAADERDPSVSQNGQRLYYVDDNGGGAVAMVAYWDDTVAQYVGGQLNPDLLDLPVGEGKIAYRSPADRQAYISASYFDGVAFRMWRLQREDTTVRFSEASAMNIGEALAVAPEIDDPHLSVDGQRLYFSAGVEPTERQLYVSTRDGEAFGPAEPIDELNMLGTITTSPTLTQNELVIVFVSNREDPDGDLWMAARPTLEDPFRDPRPVPGVNVMGVDGHPHIDLMGCVIWFSSERPSPMAAGGLDLLVARAGMLGD